MDIKLAMLHDAEGIVNLIQACILDMESKNIFQWNEHYPNRDVVTEDIQQRTLFLIKNDDDYIGMITINEDQPAEYSKIEWLEETGRNLIIHRLAVHPNWQGKGIAMNLMDFAEEYAKKKDYQSVKLDAYTANPKSNKLYEKRGYKKVGQIFIPMRELPFNCYEKVMLAI
ncbi:MAG TPA: GNAT family N-acetyltransferase [Patescibacteria group bacterium]|nr:GNAT family N-acetyltransferase [Patescibacteria group bacterium]